MNRNHKSTASRHRRQNQCRVLGEGERLTPRLQTIEKFYSGELAFERSGHQVPRTKYKESPIQIQDEAIINGLKQTGRGGGHRIRLGLAAMRVERHCGYVDWKRIDFALKATAKA